MVGLGVGLALLPGTAFADPTDEAPKEGQLDPEYAAGKAAIEGLHELNVRAVVSGAHARVARLFV